MSRKKTLVGIGLIVAIMALTGWMLFKDQPVTRLLQILGRLKPGWLVLGLGLMLVFVGCEALCSHLILGRLGHRAPYRHCLGYSFVGFYVSSITPSATGGQPAQVYYMSKDGIPAAHGALNMMLIAVCYQVVVMGYALAIVLLRFDLVTNLGTGLGLLLRSSRLGVLDHVLDLPDGDILGGVVDEALELRVVADEVDLLLGREFPGLLVLDRGGLFLHRYDDGGLRIVVLFLLIVRALVDVVGAVLDCFLAVEPGPLVEVEGVGLLGIGDLGRLLLRSSFLLGVVVLGFLLFVILGVLGGLLGSIIGCLLDIPLLLSGDALLGFLRLLLRSILRNIICNLFLIQIGNHMSVIVTRETHSFQIYTSSHCFK